MEKIKKIRKPGSGRKLGSKDKNPRNGRYLKGSYKIYCLLDEREDDLPLEVRNCYIGLTTQYLCKRLEYHIFCQRKLNMRSKRDIWIENLLNDGIKPKIVLLEILKKETSKYDALLKENDYILKYGNLNTSHNIFGYLNKKERVKKSFKYEMLNYIKKGLTQKEIKKQTGIGPSIISYWFKKYGINKKQIIKNECEIIKNMINDGCEFNFIKNKLSLGDFEFKYRLEKINNNL